MDIIDHAEYDKNIIYQNPIKIPKPSDYNSPISWMVQTQIAHNNGKHYQDRIGKLKSYPVYELPLPEVDGNKLFLDIGAGWGRWLIAGANKNYIPIGIDIKLKLCETQQQILKHFNKKGYSVVADLGSLPFQHDIFDLIWSFSVIQHTHYKRLNNCLKGIDNLLSDKGFTYLEFPNKDGFRNKRGPVKSVEQFRDEFNNWNVRYYTPTEYEKIVSKYLNSFKFDVHSFLGIGVLKEDLKYVSLKNKILCLASLALTSVAKKVPGLKKHADSIYVRAEKKSESKNSFAIERTKVFIDNFNNKPFDNLQILPLLKCPKSGFDIVLNDQRNRAMVPKAGIYYPIINDIPIIIKSEAKAL